MKTKAEKASNRKYMRKVRSEEKKKLNQDIVKLALEFGWENFAGDYAEEHAPEMLVTATTRTAPRRK